MPALTQRFGEAQPMLFRSVNEDLLVEIARYLSLRDILSIAQTGKVIRHLVSLSRSIWLATDNAFLLPPPPLGSVLDLCASELHHCAVRAVRLQHNWRNPKPSLVMTSHHRLVGLEEKPERHVEMFCGAQWVLVASGKRFWILNLTTHSVMMQQEVDVYILRGDMEEVEDGRVIIVSFVQGADEDSDTSCHLTVLRVTLPSAPADAVHQTVTSLLSLPLGSGIDPYQVLLRGDVVSILVVDQTAEEWVRSALIINWRRHCAVKAPQQPWTGLRTPPSHILIHESAQKHSIILIPELQPTLLEDHPNWKTINYPALEKTTVSFPIDGYCAQVMSSRRLTSKRLDHDCTLSIVAVSWYHIRRYHLELSSCDNVLGVLRTVRWARREMNTSGHSYTCFGSSGLRGVHLVDFLQRSPPSLVAFGFDYSSPSTYGTLQTPSEMNLSDIKALSFDDLRGVVCAVLKDGTIWFLHYV